MKVLVVGIIVLALAVAGVSTYLIQTFSGEQNLEELQKEALKPKIRVLIASIDLRPGQKLSPKNIRWQFWVDESLNPKYIVVEKDEEEDVKMEEFTGSVVREVIHEGEPIIGSKVFKSDQAGFLAGVLKSGMRAVSFTVGATTGSAGFILPGDRVDVLLTHDKVQKAILKKEKEQKKERGEKGKDPKKIGLGGSLARLVVLKDTTETIVRNLRVLAINALVDVVEGNNVPAKNVTLEVTPKQAEVLITARKMGKLAIVLRSLETPEGASEELTYTNDVDVSPFIQDINKNLAAQRKERDQLEATESEAAEASATAKSSSVPSRPRKKKKPVKIFWGGKGTFGEVGAESK